MHAKFKSDVYPMSFHVHIGCNEQDIIDYCIANNLEPLDLENHNNKRSWGWFAWVEDTPHGHLYFEVLDDPSIVVHETFHATIWAMTYIGSSLNSGSEEPWAYFQQFLYREVLKLKDPQTLPGV